MPVDLIQKPFPHLSFVNLGGHETEKFLPALNRFLRFLAPDSLIVHPAQVEEVSKWIQGLPISSRLNVPLTGGIFMKAGHPIAELSGLTVTAEIKKRAKTGK